MIFDKVCHNPDEFAWLVDDPMLSNRLQLDNIEHNSIVQQLQVLHQVNNDDSKTMDVSLINNNRNNHEYATISNR